MTIFKKPFFWVFISVVQLLLICFLFQDGCRKKKETEKFLSSVEIKNNELVEKNLNDSIKSYQQLRINLWPMHPHLFILPFKRKKGR